MRESRPDASDFNEDLTKVAGRLFLDSIDPKLKDKIEAQLDYYVANNIEVLEAKKEITFLCTALNLTKTKVNVDLKT